MKPFLGIDLTTNKKNEQLNGSVFLIQEPTFILSDALDASFEDTNKTIESSKTPLFFRIIQYISGIAALLIASGIMRADVSLAEGYKNAPLLFWTMPICTVIWLILFIWSKKKSKTVLELAESVQTFSKLDSVASAIYEDLSVPENAKEIDVLSFYYKMKNENIKIMTKSMQIAPYLNPEFKIFADKENLYLANLEGKYAFPLNSIAQIHTIKKHICIVSWNKEDKFNKGIYKQYKLAIDNYGRVHCKYYHILEINYHGKTYGLYIPSYELPILEELTGLKA